MLGRKVQFSRRILLFIDSQYYSLQHCFIIKLGSSVLLLVPTTNYLIFSVSSEPSTTYNVLASCWTQNKCQDCYYRLQCIACPTAILCHHPCTMVSAHAIICDDFLHLSICIPSRKNCNGQGLSPLIHCLGHLECHLSFISALPWTPVNNLKLNLLA